MTTKKKEPTTRSFPAGSFVVRMDQPYSRIADALLDHQYWSPEDPQKTPYDDTGWTFGELFGVQVVRVTDAKILDAGKVPARGRRLRRKWTSSHDRRVTSILVRR